MKNNAHPPGPGLAKYAYLYLRENCNYMRLARRLFKEYGDLVHIQAGSRHHYYVNHPDLAEKVLTAGYGMRTSRPRPLRHALGRGLITSQGELHHCMRKIMQPFFNKQAIAGMISVITEETERAIGPWQDGDVHDIAEDMTHLTLGVILRVLFGTNFESELEQMGKAAYLVHLYMHQDPASHINMRMEWIPFIRQFAPAWRAREYLDKKIYGLMQERRARDDLSGTDLLTSLMRIQKEHPEVEDLSDKQIRDEVLTVFIAGHETTSNALAWTWYLISEHPAVEKKLHEELDRVLAGKPPTVDDVPNLAYTRMVLSESMRIYPPVWTLGRAPEEDGFRLGGYSIPRKSTILLSPYFAHHDERFFPDPERFDPERFTPEEEAKRPKHAYMPFAGGNRRCLGEGFAWTEGVLMLAGIARLWQFRRVDSKRIHLESLIALKPKDGIRMKLERRSSDRSTPKKIQKHVNAV